MWKVLDFQVDEYGMKILLVNTEDEEFYITVDKIDFQVMDDMGLIICN